MYLLFRSRLLLVGAVMFMALGCGRSGKEQAAGPASLSEVRLGYFANLTHAQALLGVQSGDFAKAVGPAKLTTRIFNAGPSLVEALFAGEIDVAYVGPGPSISAFVKSHGQGIRVIAGAANNGVVIVARPGSGIEKLADLKGKRIATPQTANTQDIACRTFLKEKLGQTDLSNVIPVPNAQQAALMERGQIDAAWSPEPWASGLLKQAGGKVLSLENETDLWADKQFTLTAVVTAPEFLQQHPDVVKKILGVHRAWTQRLRQAPQEQLPLLDEAMFKLTGKHLAKEVLSAALKNIQFTDEPLEGTLSTMAKWSYDLGFLKQPTDLKGLVDLTLLRQLNEAAK